MMIWSRMSPIVPEWFWHKSHFANKPEIIQVTLDEEGYLCCMLGNMFVRLKGILDSGWWSGPIEKPKEPDDMEEPSSSLLVHEFVKHGLNGSQIKGVLEAIDSVCHFCQDAYEPCHCENDE